jgi:ComF family protein
LSRLVQAFKFDGRRNLASLLAPMLRVAFAGSWSRDECDLIVPVPLHGQRKRERGYNQSALLAARLARDMVLPWSEAALTRTRDTPPQVGLTDARRFENLRSAFRSHHAGLVRGKRILLVDDVMTTGATVASASAALLEAGARSVSVLTVARSVPGAR